MKKHFFTIFITIFSIVLLFACTGTLPSNMNSVFTKQGLTVVSESNQKEGLSFSFQIEKESYKIRYFRGFGELRKSRDIVINDIVLTDTGKSIMGENPPSAIKPDYSTKTVSLTIKGTFDKNIVKSDDILFKNEDKLLQVSYVGESLPKTKILIDDSIILEPLSANTQEIKVNMKTEAIPDYYLKGFHKLSILSGNGEKEDKDRTDTLIKIGDPEIPKVSLSPAIDEVKILKVKDIYLDTNSKEFAFRVTSENEMDKIKKYPKETPIALKIKGKNFMMFYKFIYVLIDGKEASGHSSVISKDSHGNNIWESIINIPEPLAFSKKNDHSISYYTPFGASVRRF